MKGAGKAFDVGVQGIQKGVQGVQKMMRPQPQLAMAGESYIYDVFDEGFGDWAGQKIGSMAGKVSGKAVNFANTAKRVLSSGWNGLTQFASQNKLAIGKAAFLMGVGALLGAGLGSLSHDAIDGVIQAIGDKGVPAEELNWLRQNFAMDRYGGQEPSEDSSSPVRTGNWVNTGKGYGGQPPTQTAGGDHMFTTTGKEPTNWNVGEIQPTQTISTKEILDNTTQQVNGVLSKLKDTFASFIRTDYHGTSAVPKPGVDWATSKVGDYVAGRAADGGEMALNYNVELLPKPGESPQQILQQAYRDLAKELHQAGVKITDMKPIGYDPSGLIKAQLSVVPSLTVAGAIGGAAAAVPQKKV